MTFICNRRSIRSDVLDHAEYCQLWTSKSVISLESTVVGGQMQQQFGLMRHRLNVLKRSLSNQISAKTTGDLCDVVFCCVDTLEARHIADLIAAAFLLPLFDVGVVIPVRKKGHAFAVADVCGRIDYVQPGGSTLQDRGIYTPESLRGEYLCGVAPEAPCVRLVVASEFS